MAALAAVALLGAGFAAACGAPAPDASRPATPPPSLPSRTPTLGPSPETFSFLVVGDTVGPVYLPFSEAQWRLVEGLVERAAGYSFSEGGAGSGGRVALEPSFAPGGGLLTRLKLTLPRRGRRQIDYRAGWATRVIETDGPGRRQTFHRAGQRWVYRSLARAMRPGGAAFCLHAGDLTFWGLQGRTADGSPYWRDLGERLLAHIPAIGLKVKALSGPAQGSVVGLGGRLLATVGNHELWGDPDLVGLQESLPALGGLGFSAGQPVWAFDYGGVRFISLDSEAFTGPAAGDRPLDYGAQMALLRGWLDEAAAAGPRRIVVLYHRPSFTRGRVRGLPAATDPHLVLREYADRLSIVVFNGHVHTTEAFAVDGVRYVVCGAGGSEQELGTRAVPDDYPVDEYWRGAPRREEYAFVEVEAGGGGELRLFLHRYRPSAPQLPTPQELFAP